ncbi:MAG TPA: class I SAM-dependent methyltransferase [Bacteroidia bacterium]|nr:class I SAM-dependent methyltransferase [Bacteroidia bacterium]HNU33804.1 class I SAM-dependent methyltransferase [Bacteroidia bacterium]
MKPWYQSWFNSPYYHLLYKERDSKEAEFFLDKLIDKLNLKTGCSIVDIACGRGRHSVYLNKKGFNVTGIDLSRESIKYCRQFENEKLEFFEHDMRAIFRVNYFEVALNLFTSFGYFEKPHDNLLALESASSSLKKNGIFVLDYFNSEKVMSALPSLFSKERNNIQFSFQKKVVDGKVIKSINVTDNGREFLFVESVWLYNKEDFEKMLESCGLKLKFTFGDYNLNAFDKIKSDRLILVTEKI